MDLLNKLKTLVNDNPNNMQLGAEVRLLINNLSSDQKTPEFNPDINPIIKPINPEEFNNN